MNGIRNWRQRGRLVGLASAALFLSCTNRMVVLELSGNVLYDKPHILELAHLLNDARVEGGGVVVTVTLIGDPGLSASFDVTPGMVERRPMREAEDGHYVGEFSFPPETVGGPFTIIGRLKHPQAGEVSLRDEKPLTIPLPEGPP